MSGIDVRIMIPCKPDHPFVYWATYSYMSDLLGVGAKCYTYDNGFLHAKGLVIDGKVACYGTANMDIRSFKLNFEVNATIYNKETATKLEDIFMEDLTKSTQITPYLYANRPLIIRIKEQISRLLSPLL
jgi:cardiolipin synthase